MRLFFDINEKRLVPALGSTAAVRSISFVRGDDTDLEVGFIRDNALVELEGAFSIVFVIKVTPGPDVVTQAIADVWTLEGDYYRASLDLTGTTLDALVGTKKTINLLCELTYTDENGGPNTSQLVTAVIGGDLYRGDELPPDAPGVPENWLQAQLSGAPSKNPPVDADTMPLSDSTAGGALRKITWANIKATLKVFFDGLYVGLTGNQSVSGVKTFASSPRSSGSPDADTSIMNRAQADLRRLPFVRPIDFNQWRQRLEYFANGDLTSGTIGEWRWDVNLDGGVLGFDYSTLFGARGIRLTTAASVGARLSLYRFTGGSTASDQCAVTFMLRNDYPANAPSLLSNGALWVGWRDSDLDSTATGYFQVGWNPAESDNILIKQLGSDGIALVVTDTGVPIPSNISYEAPALNITLVGGLCNGSLGGAVNKRRVIISGNQPIANVILLDIEIPRAGYIYNDRLFVDVETDAGTSRWVVVQGIELYHRGALLGGAG